MLELLGDLATGMLEWTLLILVVAGCCWYLDNIYIPRHR